MADLIAIKERIRKLLERAELSTVGVGNDGEIETAMKIAAKLMDEHHLKMDDIGNAQDAEDLKMGRVAATTTASWLSTWESTLAWAVLELFGCVKHYISSSEAEPIRVNGICQFDKSGKVRKGKKVYFYGPMMEAKEAAELFEEWARTIAAMGVVRWGGCYMGDGGKYCYGFALALLAKAREINGQRKLTPARPIPQLTGGTCTAITLTGRYELLKEKATEWLEEECGVKLRNRSSSGGYRSGSNAAFSEGRAHGSQAGFGRKVARKMLGA